MPLIVERHVADKNAQQPKPYTKPYSLSHNLLAAEHTTETPALNLKAYNLSPPPEILRPKP